MYTSYLLRQKFSTKLFFSLFSLCIQCLHYKNAVLLYRVHHYFYFKIYRNVLNLFLIYCNCFLHNFYFFLNFLIFCFVILIFIIVYLIWILEHLCFYSGFFCTAKLWKYFPYLLLFYLVSLHCYYNFNLLEQVTGNDY